MTENTEKRLIDLNDLRLVGRHETRIMLGGISRQRAFQITGQAHFPPPVAVLHATKVWLEDDVITWIAKHRTHAPPAGR